jgi:hypothetical protein
MPNFAERVTRFIWLVTGNKIRHCIGEIRTTHAPRLRGLDDDAFLEECRRVLDAPKLTRGEALDSGLLRDFPRHDLTDADAHAVAVACEAFARFPPQGVPAGSALHAGQLLAAVHLVRGSLVQMDTGEGKTFALSTAAFALLRTHARVYIVTANPYLAARDAVRLETFWNGVGVRVGHGSSGPTMDELNDAWDSRVVYTTLSDLEYRSLTEDLGEAGVERTLAWSAVLLDEADAILLEQSSQLHFTPRRTAPSTKDWRRRSTTSSTSRRTPAGSRRRR